MDLRLVNRRMVLQLVQDLTPLDPRLGQVHLNARIIWVAGRQAEPGVKFQRR